MEQLIILLISFSIPDGFHSRPGFEGGGETDPPQQQQQQQQRQQPRQQQHLRDKHAQVHLRI